MPTEKIIYCDKLFKFVDVEELPIDLKSGSSDDLERKSVDANIINWNTLIKVKYFGNGEYEIINKVADSPDFIENEEYLFFYV